MIIQTIITIDKLNFIHSSSHLKMGNSSSKGQFRWGDKYELIDIDSNDNLLMLMSRVGEKEYIGKQYQCSGIENMTKMQSLIDSKIMKPSLYLTKLKKVAIRRSKGTCSDSKIYYLIFEKPYQSLKTECINRKIKECRFTEDEIDCILTSSVKGIEYLKEIDQPHRHISSQSIFIREDRTIIVGDPWLNGEKIKNLHINGIIYPSPEKILYENKLISSYNLTNSALFTLGVVLLQAFTLEHMDSLYEKGFRRIKDIQIIQKINLIQSESLKKKLRILLNHQPQKRSQIFLQVKKIDHKIPFKAETENSNKNFVNAGRSLEDSQTKTIKPHKNQQVYTIINKINQSRQHSDISMSTQPRNKIHFQGTKTISFNHYNPNWYNSHQMQANYPYSDIFTTQNQQIRHFSSQKPVYTSINNSYLQNIPSKNNGFSLEIKNLPFTTVSQQEKIENKLKEQQNFQQKMQLSSIHHNSLEESQEISNIQINEAKKQTSIQVVKQIKQNSSYNVQNANQLQKYESQIPQKLQNSLQQNSIHMNFYDTKKQNSTIKQLSDESPSKDEQESNTGYRIIQYQATGSKYDGYIKDGQRDGYGIFQYNDGSYYQGQWRQNKMHGKGKLYYPSKRIAYDGSFYEDDFHGKGKLYNQIQSEESAVIDVGNLKVHQESWKEYEGDFFSNKKHGFGILVYKNGDKFFGNFRNDEIQGVGKYYKSNGEIISGQWSKGQLRTKE